MRLIFEKGAPGRRGYSLPTDSFLDISFQECVPEYAAIPSQKPLTEVSEVDVVRHFTQLSKLNHGLDDGLYPLGSCTMKYNPRVGEQVAALPRFLHVHPLAPEHTIQGSLRIMYELNTMLCEICGMDQFTMAPAAGAHGELIGILVIRQYFADRGEPRSKILVPDSAHGTNPASAAMAGYQVVEVQSNEHGTVDINRLEMLMDEKTAGLMLTNPNTVGLYDGEIEAIERIVHGRGGLLYYDGANLNASLGIVRPGDTGFDVVHLNLHKTFGAPHGGGGPGAGPVGVRSKLAPYLPNPVVTYDGSRYRLSHTGDKSIGRVRCFWTNFPVLLKAYAWILSMGPDGLFDASETSIINANYVLAKLKGHYRPSYDRFCGHECVLTARDYRQYGVKAVDIAKRLMDFGIHPPTIYFPHFPPYAEETMMIEPPESESLEVLDRFVSVMLRIAEEARTDPELVTGAPHNTPIRRTDDVLAARRPVLTYDEELRLKGQVTSKTRDTDYWQEE